MDPIETLNGSLSGAPPLGPAPGDPPSVAPASGEEAPARPPPDGARRALVAYASRKGATKGVAQRIAAGLTERGVPTELRPVEEVRDPSVYDAIVFGGAVYNQAWPQEGRDFVLRNVDALSAAETWLFSVGSFGDSRRIFGSAVRREPKGIEQLQARIEPRDYRVFAGVVEAAQWPLPERMFFRALGGRYGDNRDWAAIDAWAQRIADSLASSPSRRR